jgi:hypothetical protein
MMGYQSTWDNRLSQDTPSSMANLEHPQGLDNDASPSKPMLAILSNPQEE